MNTLFGRTHKAVSLTAALTECHALLQSPAAIALLYAPGWCRFGVIGAAGVLLDAHGDPHDLTPVFEARIFNKHVELRWLKQQGDTGRAVLLAEQPLDKYFAKEGEPLAPLQPVHVMPQSYLLWGKGAPLPATFTPAWSRLTEARIGPLDVPLAGITQVQERVQLAAREYFAVPAEDKFGNVAVVEERLLGLSRILIPATEEA